MLAVAGASQALAAGGAAVAGDATGGQSAGGPEVGGGPAGLETPSARRNGPHTGAAYERSDRENPSRRLQKRPTY
jgi:hypothetical protein